MDAARRLARSWEVTGNIMHVSQKRARGALKSYEKQLCGARDIEGNRSHRVKPCVASLTPWSTWHEAGELVRVVERRHSYAFEYPGRKPDYIKFSRLTELTEAT